MDYLQRIVEASRVEPFLSHSFTAITEPPLPLLFSPPLRSCLLPSHLLLYHHPLPKSPSVLPSSLPTLTALLPQPLPLPSPLPPPPLLYPHHYQYPYSPLPHYHHHPYSPSLTNTTATNTAVTGSAIWCLPCPDVNSNGRPH